MCLKRGELLLPRGCARRRKFIRETERSGRAFTGERGGTTEVRGRQIQYTTNGILGNWEKIGKRRDAFDALGVGELKKIKYPVLGAT